jgi:hypothetical protein
MLIYNTTYNVDTEVARNFYIWLHEVLVPEIELQQILSNPRLLKILSYQEDGNSSFSLQWEVESSLLLHHWYVKNGVKMNEEMNKIFGEKVISFSTLMEVMQ